MSEKTREVPQLDDGTYAHTSDARFQVHLDSSSDSNTNTIRMQHVQMGNKFCEGSSGYGTLHAWLLARAGSRPT